MPYDMKLMHWIFIYFLFSLSLHFPNPHYLQQNKVKFSTKFSSFIYSLRTPNYSGCVAWNVARRKMKKKETCNWRLLIFVFHFILISNNVVCVLVAIIFLYSNSCSICYWCASYIFLHALLLLLYTYNNICYFIPF